MEGIVMLHIIQNAIVVVLTVVVIAVAVNMFAELLTKPKK